MRIEYIENVNNLIRDVSLSQLTSLRAPFRMYGFEYFCGTLSMTLRPRESIECVATLSTAALHLAIRLRTEV